MSAANAAAIRRRVNNQAPVSSSVDTTPTANATPKPQTNQKGLTLPQYMGTLDKRIKTLEDALPNVAPTNTVFSQSILDEFNSRFEILATELGELKDALLKLQTFTMDVNKSLHDERIHILSDVGNQSIAGSTINTETIENEASSVDIKSMVEDELNSNKN